MNLFLIIDKYLSHLQSLKIPFTSLLWPFQHHTIRVCLACVTNVSRLYDEDRKIHLLWMTLLESLLRVFPKRHHSRKRQSCKRSVSDWTACRLLLPHSSAAVEKIFSQVNLIKTDTRNRLNTESVNGLILAKENGGNMPCYDWEPSLKMITSAQKVYKNISSL